MLTFGLQYLSIAISRMFDFYKHITETIPNYLMFVTFMVVVYMLFCMCVTFVTDQLIKVILAMRAPLVAPTIKTTVESE